MFVFSGHFRIQIRYFHHSNGGGLLQVFGPIQRDLWRFQTFSVSISYRYQVAEFSHSHFPKSFITTLMFCQTIVSDFGSARWDCVSWIHGFMISKMSYHIPGDGHSISNHRQATSYTFFDGPKLSEPLGWQHCHVRHVRHVGVEPHGVYGGRVTKRRWIGS
jgi:hypothetical protein